MDRVFHFHTVENYIAVKIAMLYANMDEAHKHNAEQGRVAKLTAPGFSGQDPIRYSPKKENQP